MGFELDISALEVFTEPTAVGDGLSEAESIEDRIDAAHRLGLEQLAVRFADLLGGSVQEGDALAIDPAKFPVLDLARFLVRFGQSTRGGQDFRGAANAPGDGSFDFFSRDRLDVVIAPMALNPVDGASALRAAKDLLVLVG